MNKLALLLCKSHWKFLRRVGAVILRNGSYWHDLIDNEPKKALEIMWKVYMGNNINWNNCQTLNEKIQWLEVFSDTTLWTEYADKYLVRQHITNLGLEEYLPKLYGVWNRVEDIDYNSLPDSFVIKCNHDCGSAIIVPNKNDDFDKEKANQKLKKHLDKIWGYRTGEPHYTRIQRRVIAEELLGGSDFYNNNKSLVDYKFWVINGKAEICFVCYDRVIGKTAVFDLYSLDPWKEMRKYLSKDYSVQKFQNIPEPKNLQKMIEIAEIIGEKHPQVRVDLYNIEGKIYFGEMTFSSYGGRMHYFSDELQEKLGKEIVLPET